MYTQQDYVDINAQFRRRWLWLVLGMLLPLAALIWSLTVRNQPLTVLITIVMLSAFIFVYGVSISPVGAYRRYLNDLLHGRNRELEGVFKGFDRQYAVRDRIRYLPFMINVGDPEEPNDDRLLYWDINLPTPDWQPGERLWIKSFDKSVTGWERR